MKVLKLAVCFSFAALVASCSDSTSSGPEPDGLSDPGSAELSSADGGNSVPGGNSEPGDEGNSEPGGEGNSEPGEGGNSEGVPSSSETQASSSSEAAAGPALLWSDEFDYEGAPDPAKWGYDVGGDGWGNSELQYYTDSRENSYVSDGALHIVAKKQQMGSNQYTSARLVTRGKGDWLYGRVEVRAKLPTGKGTWPAIWMLPTDWAYGGWPASGELDIMEHVGYAQNEINCNIHTQSYNHSIGTNKGNKMSFADVAGTWHVYALEWSAERVAFFVDETRVFAFANEHATFAEWPFDKRFHLLLNVAWGGSWGGAQGIDDSALPATMLVDYVRVYELPERDPGAEGENLVYNGDFSAGTSGWTLVQNDGSSATLDASGGAAEVSVSAGGTQRWSVGLSQGAIPVTAGGLYELSFDASSPNGAVFDAGVGQSSGDYATYVKRTVSPGSSVQRYSYEFTATETNAAARVFFDLGQNGGKSARIDNVKLVEKE